MMRNMAMAMWLVLIGLPVGAGPSNPYLHLLHRSERLVRTFEFPGRRPVVRTQAASCVPVPVLVQSTDPDTTARAVRASGAHAGRPVGAILPVRACLDTLQVLSRRPEVIRVEASPPRQPTLDISRIELGADRSEAGDALPFPIDGRGVIAAVVDTGVDYDHPDFGAGRSRVQLIWDLAFGSGDPPAGYDVGSLCDRSSIRTGSCDSIDIVGHGTHVAATMAGSGDTYRGLAPAADIMAVASIDFGLLVESITWLFEQADARDQPMVVNLSLGGHYGPHDGTSLESQALSDLVGPGHIIVAAAGNEGSDFIHLGYDPGGDEGKTLFHVFSGLDVSAALFTIWHPPDATLSFAVGVQAHGEEIDQTPFASVETGASRHDLQDGTTGLGQVYLQPAAGPNPNNGKIQIDIAVEPTDVAYQGNQQGYVWYLKVRGRGAFNAWSAAAGFLTPPARFSDRDDNGLVPGDNARTVAAPALAPGVIAVASYATRSSWIDHQGTEQQHEETSPGTISFFSSRGPSADPARTGPKPWIAAPGEFIVAALSEHSGELQPGTRVDDRHIAMRGTSMACPHAAGAVALLLQVDPTLDPDAIRALLAATARSDEHTQGRLPDATWGHGKLDAYEAVARALGVGLCQTDGECARDYRCTGEGRCTPRSEGGCGCTSEVRGGLWLLVLFGAWAALRRDEAGRRFIA